ncbi:hypothetical protein VTO73DRAFT_4291 [Trametes versicolor]
MRSSRDSDRKTWRRDAGGTAHYPRLSYNISSARLRTSTVKSGIGPVGEHAELEVYWQKGDYTTLGGVYQLSRMA